MTDIIFKTNITQPASNVVNLNFVDSVVALGFAPVSSISFQAQCDFQVVQVVPIKPISVAVESVIETKITAGFKIVHQGNGDPYFDKVKLLCHFDRSTGNGAAFNVANRTRGLISTGQTHTKDADTVIDYIADTGAFEGDIVSCYVIVNSFVKANNAFVATEIPVSQYQGDYGKNLSVRGKDWCLDARLKIDDQYSYAGIDIFSSNEIRVNIFLNHIYNSQNVSVPAIRVTLYLDNIGHSYLVWDKIQITDGDFSTIKLICTDGRYELWVNGELFDGTAWYASTTYKTSIKSYTSSSRSHAIAPTNVFHVGIDIDPYCSLPTYQLFGEDVSLHTFNNLSTEYTPDNLAAIQALPNFQSITTTQKTRVYLSKTSDILNSKLGTNQDILALKTQFGIDHIVVTTNYIEVFFDQTIIVEASVRFDFPTPITVHFDCDLLKVATGAISGYQGGSALLYCGNFVLNSFFASSSLTLQIIGGVCNVLYSTLSNASSKLDAKNITYVDGLAKDFTFKLPELEEINDTTSYIFSPTDLWSSTPTVSAGVSAFDNIYKRNLYRVVIATQKSDRTYNGKQLTDVTEIYSSGVLHPDTSSYTTDFDAAVSSTQDITKLKTLGDTGIINYSVRQDPVIYNNYQFGINRFIVDKNYIEIIFDGVTFVENSHRFNTPFEFRTVSTPQGNINNYDAVFTIANNEFTLLITKTLNDANAAVSIAYAPQVFVATVKNYDSKIYDATNANYLTVNGDNLDEMRFTIDASRLDERGVVPTEPFPDFIENRISFKPSFEMGAVYDFGKNNLISITPNFKFKDFTKKPKVTTPITKVITLGRVSLIEFLPSFNFIQEKYFNFNAQINIEAKSYPAPVVAPNQKCDLLFSDVVVLLPFDASPIIDVMNHAVTAGANAQITATQIKFLPDSVYFPAVAGQEIKVAHDDRMGIRKGDIFCIEFWFYAMPQASTISPVIIAQFGASVPSTVNTNYYTFNWRIVRTYDNRIFVDYGSPTGGYSNIGQMPVFAVKQWHHVRITNEGYYFNGAKITTQKTFDVFTQGSFKPDFNSDWIIQFGITNAQGQQFKGYVSDFRMTKGDNRLTDTLPPTDSYPTVACGAGVTPTPTPAPTPVITPILFKPSSTIAFNILETMQAFYPVKFNPKSAIEINIRSDFEVFHPIQFAAQSTIIIAPSFDLQRTKIELIYLAADNRSKASTGFVDKLLAGIGVAEIFANGVIEFYTGSRPYSANHAVTGTLLGSISGIKFGIPQNRIIKKEDSQTWLLNAIASGKIGWFRIKADWLSDYGQDSLIEARLDGEAGIDSISISFNVVSGDIYHIQDFAVMWGNG